MLVIFPAVEGPNTLLLVVSPRQPLLFASAATCPSTFVLVQTKQPCGGLTEPEHSNVVAGMSPFSSMLMT